MMGMTDATAVAHKTIIWIHPWGLKLGRNHPSGQVRERSHWEVFWYQNPGVAVTTRASLQHSPPRLFQADAIIYFPLDLPFVSDPFVKRIIWIFPCRWKRNCGQLPADAAAPPVHCDDGPAWPDFRQVRQKATGTYFDGHGRLMGSVTHVSVCSLPVMPGTSST